MAKQQKASLDEQMRAVEVAFNAQFPGAGSDDPMAVISRTYIVETDIEAGFVIVTGNNKYFRVPMSEEGGAFSFSSINNWQEVAQETAWVSKAIRLTGNTLKSISVTDDEIRLGNYIILFGDENNRDLEYLRKGANDDGSLGEYFTANTLVESYYTKMGRFPIDMEHGTREEFEGVEIGPDRDDIMGYVDWKTKAVDDVGVWVERVLFRANEYANALGQLIEAGYPVGTSSEPVQKSVKVEKNGHISRWELARDTFTVSPAEPRMMSGNTLTALKTLGINIPEKPHDATPAPVATDDPKPAKHIKQTKGVNTMFETREEALSHFAETVGLKVDNLNAQQKSIALRGTEWEADEAPVMTATQAKALAKEAAESAVAELKKSLPAINGKPGKAGVIEVTKDEADQDFATEGEFFQAVKNVALNPANMDPRLKARKAGTGANEAVPAEGGFLVGTQTNSGIVSRMYGEGEILSRISKDTISGDNNGMSYNRVDETSRANGSRQGGIQGYWLAEGGTITASQPTFDRLDLRLKKVAALAYATDELLADSQALESWLNREVPNELIFKVEDAIYNGAVAGIPAGIMGHNALQTVTRIDANEIDATDVSNMWARRWARGNYIWLAEQSIFPQLQVMAIANQPVYLPPGGMTGAPNATLLGAPIFEVEYAASLGTTGDLMLVDLSQYQAIDRGGINSASSIHVQFLTDQTVFRFTYRFDGAPFWKAGVTPFSGASARSPYVVLSTSS